MPNRDNAGPVDNGNSNQSALYTLPYRDLQIRGGFWAKYQEINRAVSLSHGFSMLEKAGNLRNLRIAAGQKDGNSLLLMG